MQDLPEEEEPAGEGEEEREAAKGGNKPVSISAAAASSKERNKAEGKAETPEERERRLEEEEGWFDPNLKSQSVVEYESRGARILAPSERQVNVLKMGVRYTYEYYVDFEIDAKDVPFGLTLNTITDNNLAGVGLSRVKALQVKALKANSSAHVQFAFRCILMPNTYFLSAGVSGVTESERQYFHRMLDAICLRVDTEK